MKNNKVYIAGKITGDAKYREKFAQAERYLTEWLEWKPEEVVNPVKECCQRWPWWRCMLRCLRLICGCKFVAMLPDWNESRGARIEHGWAQMIGKVILYLNTLNY
ncbi:MAG: DUF4406 domain-containing protein [Bacteroidales bacterium]|nr:DUF4406 domain-containing protein [Bacteroidales bacterium]